MEVQEEGEEEEEEELRMCEGDIPLSVLDPSDGLDLGSLGMGAKLTVTLVLSSATVALQDVLVATVARVLVAHKGSALNLHGSNLLVHPAHGLQRRVVISQLKLTTGHILILEDGHFGLLVVSAADGPEGDHPLNAVGVAATVGLKTGVVSLLQDELLAAEAGVLVANPGATLDLQGTDVLHPALHNVLAAGSELHALSLEVLLIVHSDLPGTHGHWGCLGHFVLFLSSTKNEELCIAGFH